jgi:hypothetical protein
MSSKININDLKEWINNNLIYSRGLICKKCKEEWFAKYKYLNEWNAIHELTFHFNTSSPTFPQRVWHIINDMPIVKCANPSCNNLPTFFSYSRGYLKTCSPTCAQFNPDTIEKICNTNIAKYGVKYGLSNKDIIKKREQTLYNKYGVKNVSQLSEISEKKQETCLANYGTKWFLERQDLKELAVQKKYGVKNIQQTVAAKQKQT